MDVQADADFIRQVRLHARDVPGVRNVEKLRVRKSGLEYFADIHVQVDSQLTVAEGHRIGHAVKDRLLEKFPSLRDALVHPEPYPHIHEAKEQPMRLRSSAFHSGDPIPKRHTADGEDVSPPLEWTDLPAGTRELALICDDPDAPTPQPWVHWIIYHLPPDAAGLPQAVPAGSRLAAPAGAVQGRNSWSSGSTIGFRGPASPPGHGTHHYRFRLYALDVALDAPPSLDKPALLQAMSGHVLAEAELIGAYER